jgi:hypothetical protein
MEAQRIVPNVMLTRVCDAAIQEVAQECLAAVSDWVLPNL